MTFQYFPQQPLRQDEFKSEGEAQIGRCLSRYGIPYRYEPPVAVVDRGNVRIWYPDFQLAGSCILIEYAGVRDNKAYQQALRRKELVYRANGLDALVIEPDFFRGNWPDRLLDQIGERLTQRSEAFHALRQKPRPHSA